MQANITASLELENMWKEEMIFRGRFIDDIVILPDITDVNIPLDQYLSNIFQHKFLRFTYEFNLFSIPFLDINIELNDNIISTSLYKKPMSKHEYLHFTSNHPRHILNALPYSCGLRIIRCCSSESTRTKELNLMFDKFRTRGYPQNLLSQIRVKLENVDRKELLLPKTILHLQALKNHNPFFHEEENKAPSPHSSNPATFVILPFYNTMPRLKQKVHKAILGMLLQCRSNALKKTVLDLNVKIAYTIPSAMNRFLS